jgi:ketosteroid isomerase-like protein
LKKLLIFLPVLFIMSACTDGVDTPGKKESMMQADRDFSRLSIEQGTYEAFDTYMADSATIYRNNQHPFTGREAIRSILPEDDPGTLQWEPLYADIAQSGDLGYTLGKYEYIFTDSTGAEQVSEGYYVTIWKKQPDGSWKYVFDTGVQAPKEE